MNKQIFVWDYSRMSIAEFKEECAKDSWTQMAFNDILKYIRRMNATDSAVMLDRFSWECESARKSLSGYFYAKGEWTCFDYCTHLVDVLYSTWARNAKRISQG